jgi:hypothetical protein
MDFHGEVGNLSLFREGLRGFGSFLPIGFHNVIRPSRAAMFTASTRPEALNFA